MSDFWTEKQKQDIAFFEENVKTWLKEPLYRTKFAVISGRELKGIYDSFENAIRYAAVTFNSGEYIVQQVLDENEIVNFLSPAIAK